MEQLIADQLARRLSPSRFSRSLREISQSCFPMRPPSRPSRFCIDAPARAGQLGLARRIRVRPKANASGLRKSPDPHSALPSKAIRRRLPACLESQCLDQDNVRVPTHSPGYAINFRRVNTRHTAHKLRPDISNCRTIANAAWKYW